MQTRAKYFGFELVVGDLAQAQDGEYYGALLQYVGKDGDVVDLTDVIAGLKASAASVAVAADVMSLVLLKSPADMVLMWLWVTPNASVCLWALVVLTLLTLPLPMLLSALSTRSYHWCVC